MNQPEKVLAIIGASGHGKVVADIAVRSGYEKIIFFDDNEQVKFCGTYPVIGKSNEAAQYDIPLFIAIGHAEIRKLLMERYAEREFPVLIHPDAVIADSVKIGAGSVIMAGAVINPDVTVGDGVIINTCSSVDHDCLIGSFSHIAVGAHLCGEVSVGENTWIGAGAIVKNNLFVCQDCIIGAGAVVVKNVNIPGTYVGVPARFVKPNSLYGVEAHESKHL